MYENHGLNEVDVGSSVTLEETEEDGPMLGWGLWALEDLSFSRLAAPSSLTDCLMVQGSCLDSAHCIHIPAEERRRHKTTLPLFKDMQSVNYSSNYWPQPNLKEG